MAAAQVVAGDETSVLVGGAVEFAQVDAGNHGQRTGRRPGGGEPAADPAAGDIELVECGPLAGAAGIDRGEQRVEAPPLVVGERLPLEVRPLAADPQRGIEGLGRVAAERGAVAAAFVVEGNRGFDAQAVAGAPGGAQLGAVGGEVEGAVDDPSLFGRHRVEAVGVEAEEVGLQGEPAVVADQVVATREPVGSVAAAAEFQPGAVVDGLAGSELDDPRRAHVAPGAGAGGRNDASRGEGRRVEAGPLHPAAKGIVLWDAVAQDQRARDRGGAGVAQADAGAGRVAEERGLAAVEGE